MTKTGRPIAAFVALCIALQKCRTVDAVAVCVSPTGAAYMNQPYLFEAPVQNAQASRYTYNVETPELSQYPFPVCGMIHRTEVPAINVFPRHACECTGSERIFTTPTANVIQELYTCPYFLRREYTPEDTLRTLETNLFHKGREDIPVQPYSVAYMCDRNPNRNDFLPYIGHVPSRTLARSQRHITLVSPSATHCNISVSPWTSVTVIEKITYTFPSKSAYKKAKTARRRKRSTDRNESNSTSESLSKVRNKRDVSEPMHVSLMGSQCDGCGSWSEPAHSLQQQENYPRVSDRAPNIEKEDQPAQWNNLASTGSSFSNKPACSSPYCKKSTSDASPENNLSSKVQKYLDKLKRDYEAFKVTIEKKTAEAREKLQSQNSLGKLEDKLRKDIKQSSEKPVAGNNVNKNNILLGKSYDASGWKSIMEDHLINTDQHRETRNSNSQTGGFNVEDYGTLLNLNSPKNDGSSTSVQDIIAKLLIKKLVEEPVLMKFIKDYLLRFVNVTAVVDEENGGVLETQVIREKVPSGTVHTKRSDGSYLKHSVSDASESGSAQCGAPEHMCARGYIRQGKNAERALQKTNMEGAGLGDDVSFSKLSHDDNIRSKNVNDREEQVSCSCSDSPLKENKYGIKANTEANPKTPSLGSNMKAGFKTALFDEPKSDQGLPESSLLSNKNINQPFDVAKDSGKSLLEDIKELLQNQQCKCSGS